LIGPDQPIIIDWFDAAAGSPAADIVRSSVLMRNEAASGYLPCADPSLIAFVHDRYVAAVLRTRKIDIQQLLAWEPTVLAARLAELIPEPIRRTSYQMWRALRAEQASQLAKSLRAPGNEQSAAT
jgi:hypothetical protein